jgi:hypothetical protein
MRPRGSYGEVTMALVRAAAEHGPGTVRDLAARACVGFGSAERKASVLVQRGDLVVLDGGQRPRMLAVPKAAAAVSFWNVSALD